MAPALKNIVIAGGGTAGWMTAAALSSLPGSDKLSITLIESEEIGIIGVGEATIPDIINFNQLLGIDEADFIRETNATFKLGIEFIDWGRQGDRYIHPFGGHGVDMNGYDFHQYWLRSQAAGNSHPIDDYSLCAVTARHGKFTHPDPNPRSILSHIRYAYHFDASLYARYLRGYAEKRGVRRIEGKIRSVGQAPETGHITHLDLEDGRSVQGDFFFDCSGFRSLLLGQALGVGHIDWSHWLPCNSAQAVPSAHSGSLTPYTRVTAKASGWQWRIPTQTRTGNGHVYCRDFISDDEAASVLLSGLDGEALAMPRTIRFTAGHRQTFWEKNCIAIGLSAGFLEPLESTSIYLIQEGISRFISLFPDSALPDVLRNEYNRHMKTEFEQVRDFIILHFKATERNDSAFWDYCRNMTIPDTLAHKIALFRQGGRVFRYEDELFSRSSWVAVFLGQNIVPDSCDPVIASLPADEVMASVESMRTAMQQTASQMPTHEEVLKRYRKAGAA
jgi:tryptophan halogenase